MKETWSNKKLTRLFIYREKCFIYKSTACSSAVFEGFPIFCGGQKATGYTVDCYKFVRTTSNWTKVKLSCCIVCIIAL